MNKVILLGRLTKLPEIRYTETNNKKVATFTLAVNRKYVKEGEERQADFINIVAYSKLADFSEKYLRKGIQVCLTGRLQIRTWEDSNGDKKYFTEILAEEIYFADSQKGPDESILAGGSKTENNEKSEDFTLESDDLPF